MTQYTAQYQANDVAVVTIDFIVAILAFFVGFASLVALVIIFRMFFGKKRR